MPNLMILLLCQWERGGWILQEQLGVPSVVKSENQWMMKESSNRLERGPSIQNMEIVFVHLK